MLGNKTVEKWKRIEPKMQKLLDKEFGIRKYQFLGDCYKGRFLVVITAKETK